MMVVSVQTRPTFQAYSPRVLFDVRSYREEFDISPDGHSFLMIKKELQIYDGQINVVLNWFEELKRLVPVTTGCSGPAIFGVNSTRIKLLII